MPGNTTGKAEYRYRLGETIEVVLGGKKLQYKLVDKTTRLTVEGDEQLVTTAYWFALG